MPMDPSLIMGAIQGSSQGLNALANSSVNKQTRQWNEKMYQWQRQDALADWNMMNKYNSPSEQMARLKQAGLNPNLVYGNGADAQANSAPRSAAAPSWNPRPAQFDPTSALGSIYDTQLKQAQIDNLSAQKSVLTQDAALKAAQVVATIASTGKTNADKAKVLQDTQQASDLFSTTIEKAKADVRSTLAATDVLLSRNEREAVAQTQSLAEGLERILRMRTERNQLLPEQIREIKARIDNMQKDGTLKDYEINLRKMGINPNDPTWQRVLVQMLQGETIKNVKSGVDVMSNIPGAWNPFGIFK